MEYEVRYYFSEEKIKDVIKRIEGLGLKKSLKTYEKTSQYNHSDQRFNFYSLEIDGRFRIRISKNDETNKCMISWKRRLKDTKEGLVNKEEEKEVRINYEDYDNLIFIINNVLHMELVESYERYRTNYSNDEVEISIDEYPFGIALEIENKGISNPEEAVKKYVEMLGLDINDSYRLSWDDKYSELCKEQNIKELKEVSFGKEMPKIM